MYSLIKKKVHCTVKRSFMMSCHFLPPPHNIELNKEQQHWKRWKLCRQRRKSCSCVLFRQDKPSYKKFFSTIHWDNIEKVKVLQEEKKISHLSSSFLTNPHKRFFSSIPWDVFSHGTEALNVKTFFVIESNSHRGSHLYCSFVNFRWEMLSN